MNLHQPNERIHFEKRGEGGRGGGGCVIRGLHSAALRQKMVKSIYRGIKCVVFVTILLRSFLLVLGVFYILTYYFYQILGNAPLIVKIYHKNILFLSTITKLYFFFCNFYYYSLTELSSSVKRINKILNHTIL